MKTIILTIDYELFLGTITGDVQSCMYDPTEKLARLLADYQGKMTIFWDILHYYKLLEYQAQYPELKNDISKIEAQILSLARQGHDIQLHLHPHWLDAVYEKKKWHFDYTRFRLHSLSQNDDQNDINTITGCIHISKKLLENLIRKVKPKYKVTTFRAGGYLVQPFSTLKDALLKNDIPIDSSVCPGLKNDNEIFSYDFQNYPRLRYYKFSEDPKKATSGGYFTEIPIQTIKIPVHMNLYFAFLRNIKYKNLYSRLMGTGSGQSTNQASKNILIKIFNLVFRSDLKQFTTDGNFKEIFLYMLRKSENNSTMILHSKLINDHVISLLLNVSQKNKAKFISLKDHLASLDLKESLTSSRAYKKIS